MPRLTLQDCRMSRIPEVLGVCSADLPQIAAAVNAAQQRLVYAKEAGDEGWYGSFADMAINVLQSDPFIALGRWGARVIRATVCKDPIAINNQFFEYLMFGNGRQPRFDCSGAPRTNGICGTSQAYMRGSFPTWRDMTRGHNLRFRCIDTLDEAGTKRVLVQGTDSADHTITSLDGTVRVQGIYLTLDSPFVDTPFVLNTLTGLQKDATNGPIEVWDVDPVTAVETLLLTMEGGEMVAGYPRYYLGGLPRNCCPVVNVNGVPTVQVTALVKLALVPVIAPSDYLLIQCLEAVIAECQAGRYSTMDNPSAKSMAIAAHRDAIRLLNGELAHFYGTDNPAVNFQPFGSAHLTRQAIGTLM